MRAKNILSVLVLSVISLTSFSQNSVWYFGTNNAGGTSYGLDFSGGGAPVQRNGESAIGYYESVSTVSDAAGNILFYTDGIEIYDASHNLMAGAPAALQGTGAGPTASSVQGAFSMLRPGSTTEYYLFTSQSIDGAANGFRVNRIDMSKDGNGAPGSKQGEVVTVDSLLSATGTEMMTAYGVCGTDTVWVMSHLPSSNDFIRVLVTDGGIQSVQTQTIATPTQWSTGIATSPGRGSIDINSDGDKLIMTGQWPIGSHILDFDKSTGLLSNHQEVKDHTGATFNGYGSEFSPDGTKAYFASNLVAGIWQYDLNTGLSTLVPTSAGLTTGEIITGIDDKLYVGKVSQSALLTVGVIDSPDAIGGPAVNYDPDAITFPGGTNAAVSYAMPQGFFCLVLDSCDIDSVAAVCDTTPAFQFTATTAGGVWGGGPYITAGGMFDPSLASTGLNWITYQGGCLGIDSVQIQVNNCCPDIDPSLGNNVTICDDQTMTLDAGAGLTTYEWKENGVVMVGQIGSTITADSGTYVVNVTNADGCPGTDTIEIGNYQLPIVDLGPDTFYCAQDSIQLDAGAGFASYVWTPNIGSGQTVFAKTAVDHIVVVTDGNGCNGTDTVEITVRALPVPTITGNTIVCEDSTTMITGVAGSGGALAWSGITPFTNPLAVTAAGTYTIIETDANGCVDSADYTLTLENLPAVNLGGPYTFCHTQGSQTLDASTGAANETYAWSDGSTDPTLNVTDSSIVSVIVTSQNGCIAYDTAVIDTFSLPIVDLGPDTFYCAQDSIQLDAGAGYVSYAWNPNVGSGQTIFANTVSDYIVVVTDGNGCTGTDTVAITESALPIPTITGNTIVCQDSTTMITGVAGSGGSLAWSGITPFTNPLAVTAAGTYTIIETDANGCVDSADYTLTLENLPAVNLGGPYTFCHTQGSQTLDASTGATNETYAWSDGSSNSTLNVTDSSIVSVIVTSQNGCIAYDTAVIDTFSLPIVDLGPDTFYCAQDSIQLDAGAGYVSYVWNPNVGNGQTIFANTISDYIVVVTDGNGCTGTDTVSITENALPTVNIGPDTTICEADSFIIDATHADAASYAWTPNSETSATIKVGSSAATYEVTITDVDGCVFVTDRTISEESLPVVNLGSNDTICDDLTKTLDAGAGYTYAWYLDGTLLGNTSQTQTADSGTYVVSVTTTLGCETRDTILVDNHQLPVVNLGGPFEYCSLDSVELDAGGTDLTYAWSPTNETTKAIWAKQVGSFTVTVTDTNGCVNSSSTNVTENTLPPVDLGANDSACVGLSIVLDATVANGVSYVWSDGYNQASYTITNPDTLSVVVTDGNGCIGYDTIEIKMLEQLDLQFGDTTIECEISISDLDAGNYQGGVYSWTLPDGSTNSSQIITPNVEGWYSINITDKFNCMGEDSIYVVIIPVPNINLGDDTSFCSLGQDTYTIRMVFDAQVTGSISWNEDNNNSNDSLFTATYAPSTVIGTFLDNYGCAHIDTVELTEFCEPTKIILPNIFTPGGTNNTTFHPIGLDDNNYVDIVNNIVSSEFEIYNRWGLKVYQSENLLPRWDGMFENRPAASGTYYWIYKYKDSSLKEYQLNGFVQMIQMR